MAARRIVFRRMDGTMSVTQRDKAIQDFQERADVNVLIVSLKAAALGLNLVAANHVVLLDLVRVYASTQLCCGVSSKEPQGLHCRLDALPGCFLQQAVCMHLTLPFALSGRGVCLNRGVCTTALGPPQLVRCSPLRAPHVASVCSRCCIAVGAVTRFRASARAVGTTICGLQQVPKLLCPTCNMARGGCLHLAAGCACPERLLESCEYCHAWPLLACRHATVALSCG